MKIWVSGTVAYDVILDYPGRFTEHINPEKVHVISLSFLVNAVKKSVGGTAANIAYSLNMLGERAAIIGTVGEDGRELVKKYQKLGIDISNLKISRKLGTATGYIMTDRDDNQIAGFYPGAMREKSALPKIKKGDLAIIAAEDPANMARLAQYFQKNKINYIFDPGQAITALSKKQMQICLRGASILIGNDYEIGVVGKFRGITICTLGPKGSEIILPSGNRIRVGIVKPRKALDPTGAGDAYRAGLVKGIVTGLDLKRSAQLGATAAASAVEHYGTQNHRFNYGIIVKRHNLDFSSKI